MQKSGLVDLKSWPYGRHLKKIEISLPIQRPRRPRAGPTLSGDEGVMSNLGLLGILID